MDSARARDVEQPYDRRHLQRASTTTTLTLELVLSTATIAQPRRAIYPILGQRALVQYIYT